MARRKPRILLKHKLLCFLWVLTICMIYVLHVTYLTTNKIKLRLNGGNQSKILIYSEVLPSIVRNRLKTGFNGKQCPNCMLVEEFYTDYDTRDFDAFVFIFNRVNLADPVFTKRLPHQLFVWYSPESTSSVRYTHQYTMENYDDVFNLTMTYRLDSDVWTPYGTLPEVKSKLLQKFPSLTADTLNEVLREKKSLLVWVASNCGFTVGAKLRLEIVDTLNHSAIGDRLDVYGQCGNLKAFENTEKGFQEMHKVIRSYKFYLALENSYHCRDYITEKFWENSLLNAAVPIVWGPTKEDILKVAPAGSFIHMDDFTSIAELADYLVYLDRNDTAYKEYFSWWFKPSGNLEPVGLCKLCSILNDKTRKPQTVQNLESWFYQNDHYDCLNHNKP
uniref:Fucosyltransferase n=1 Tax=Ciona savignyi TaxID=51511 RepID=H2YJ49_CIOSA